MSKSVKTKKRKKEKKRKIKKKEKIHKVLSKAIKERENSFNN